MATVIDAVIRLKDSFTSVMDKATKSALNSAKQIQRTGKSIESTGKSLSSFGSTLTKSVTVPIAAAITASTKLAVDFQESMAKVETIADTTQSSLSTLSSGILNLSNQTGVSATDLSESLYQTISAGVSTKDSVNFLSSAVKLAKGGFTDTNTAIDALTTTVNAYGLKVSDVTSISDQLIMTQNLGKTTVGELGSSLGNVIPIASTLGVSTTDLFSSIAELTKNGINADEAITGLKGAYTNILSPTTEAATTAKQLGIDFSAAHLKSVGWAKFLAEIKEKTGGSTTAMSSLFGNVKALNSVLVLTGKGSSDFSNILDQMSKSTGAANKAFETMENTDAEKFTKAITQLKNAGIKLGQSFTPAITEVSNIVGKLTAAFQKLTPQQQQTLVKFLLVAAAAGPVIKVIGGLVTHIGNLVTNFGKAAKAIKAAGSIMGLITSPAGLVVLAIVAIVAVIIVVIKFWPQISGFFKNLGKICTQVGTAIGSFFTKTVPKAFNSFIGFIKALPTNAAKFLGQLPGKIGYALGLALGTLVKWGINAVKWAIKNVPIIISNIIKFFKELPLKLALAIVNGISALKTWTINMIATAKVEIPKIIDSIITFFKELPDKMLDIGKNIVKGLWKGITSMVSWIKDKVKDFSNGVLSGFKSALGISSPSKVMADKVGKWIPAGIASGISKNSSMVSSAMSNINDRLVSKTPIIKATVNRTSNSTASGSTEKSTSLKSTSRGIYINVSGNVISSDYDVDRIATIFVKKLKAVEVNM